jgi:hypothetical protein
MQTRQVNMQRRSITSPKPFDAVVAAARIAHNQAHTLAVGAVLRKAGCDGEGRGNPNCERYSLFG